MNAPARFDHLSELRAAGLTVTLDAGRLIVTPASVLTDAHRRSLRENRARILAALNAEDAGARELTGLVRECGDAYRFTEAEHAEALATALADPAAALECFRSIRVGLAREGRIREGDE